MLNLTIIAVVALVAIVSLVALVMNAGSGAKLSSGSQFVSAQQGLDSDSNVAGQVFNNNWDVSSTPGSNCYATAQTRVIQSGPYVCTQRLYVCGSSYAPQWHGSCHLDE